MQTGQIQGDGQVRQASAALRHKLHLPTGQGLHIHRTHLHALTQPVAHHGALEAAQDATHAKVVAADHGRAIKGQPVQKLNEGLVQAVQAVTIGFHVIGVDVGDHAEHRGELQE